ncbi:MAG: hypothetical protein LBV34_26335, partial [Nocardiopsaceae bacterium]|nr:hypothetical protein [Nocardiopsaceae bacterium]
MYRGANSFDPEADALNTRQRGGHTVVTYQLVQALLHGVRFGGRCRRRRGRRQGAHRHHADGHR